MAAPRFCVLWAARVLGVLLLGVVAPRVARAEIQLGLYSGWNGSFDSDVHFQQPAGTDMTLKNVPWDGVEFVDGEFYWGTRATYWFESGPQWGIALEYTHAKVRAQRNAIVDVSGTRDGVPVGGPEPVLKTFGTLEFTDGLNIFTVDALFREECDCWTTYLGLGVGLSVPHVEVQRSLVADPLTFEYELAGVAAQAFAGVEYKLSDHLSLFGECKLSFTQNDTHLVDGGSLNADVWTVHMILGMTYHFDRACHCCGNCCDGCCD